MDDLLIINHYEFPISKFLTAANTVPNFGSGNVGHSKVFLSYFHPFVLTTYFQISKASGEM